MDVIKSRSLESSRKAASESFVCQQPDSRLSIFDDLSKYPRSPLQRTRIAASKLRVLQSSHATALAPKPMDREAMAAYDALRRSKEAPDALLDSAARSAVRDYLLAPAVTKVSLSAGNAAPAADDARSIVRPNQGALARNLTDEDGGYLEAVTLRPRFIRSASRSLEKAEAIITAAPIRAQAALPRVPPQIEGGRTSITAGFQPRRTTTTRAPSNAPADVVSMLQQADMELKQQRKAEILDFMRRRHYAPSKNQSRTVGQPRAKAFHAAVNTAPAARTKSGPPAPTIPTTSQAARDHRAAKRSSHLGAWNPPPWHSVTETPMDEIYALQAVRSTPQHDKEANSTIPKRAPLLIDARQAKPPKACINTDENAATVNGRGPTVAPPPAPLVVTSPTCPDGPSFDSDLDDETPRLWHEERVKEVTMVTLDPETQRVDALQFRIKSLQAQLAIFDEPLPVPPRAPSPIQRAPQGDVDIVDDHNYSNDFSGESLVMAPSEVSAEGASRNDATSAAVSSNSFACVADNTEEQPYAVIRAPLVQEPTEARPAEWGQSDAQSHCDHAKRTYAEIEDQHPLPAASLHHSVDGGAIYDGDVSPGPSPMHEQPVAERRTISLENHKAHSTLTAAIASHTADGQPPTFRPVVDEVKDAQQLMNDFMTSLRQEAALAAINVTPQASTNNSNLRQQSTANVGNNDITELVSNPQHSAAQTVASGSDSGWDHREALTLALTSARQSATRVQWNPYKALHNGSAAQGGAHHSVKGNFKDAYSIFDAAATWSTRATQALHKPLAPVPLMQARVQLVSAPAATSSAAVYSRVAPSSWSQTQVRLAPDDAEDCEREENYSTRSSLTESYDDDDEVPTFVLETERRRVEEQREQLAAGYRDAEERKQAADNRPRPVRNLQEPPASTASTTINVGATAVSLKMSPEELYRDFCNTLEIWQAAEDADNALRNVQQANLEAATQQQLWLAAQRMEEEREAATLAAQIAALAEQAQQSVADRANAIQSEIERVYQAHVEAQAQATMALTAELHAAQQTSELVQTDSALVPLQFDSAMQTDPTDAPIIQRATIGNHPMAIESLPAAQPVSESASAALHDVASAIRLALTQQPASIMRAVRHEMCTQTEAASGHTVPAAAPRPFTPSEESVAYSEDFHVDTSSIHVPYGRETTPKVALRQSTMPSPDVAIGYSFDQSTSHISDNAEALLDQSSSQDVSEHIETPGVAASFGNSAAVDEQIIAESGEYSSEQFEQPTVDESIAPSLDQHSSASIVVEGLHDATQSQDAASSADLYKTFVHELGAKYARDKSLLHVRAKALNASTKRTLKALDKTYAEASNGAPEHSASKSKKLQAIRSQQQDVELRHKAGVAALKKASASIRAKYYQELLDFRQHVHTGANNSEMSSDGSVSASSLLVLENIQPSAQAHAPAINQATVSDFLGLMMHAMRQMITPGGAMPMHELPSTIAPAAGQAAATFPGSAANATSHASFPVDAPSTAQRAVKDILEASGYSDSFEASATPDSSALHEEVGEEIEDLMTSQLSVNADDVPKTIVVNKNNAHDLSASFHPQHGSVDGYDDDSFIAESMHAGSVRHDSFITEPMHAGSLRHEGAFEDPATSQLFARAITMSGPMPQTEVVVNVRSPIFEGSAVIQGPPNKSNWDVIARLSEVSESPSKIKASLVDAITDILLSELSREALMAVGAYETFSDVTDRTARPVLIASSDLPSVPVAAIGQESSSRSASSSVSSPVSPLSAAGKVNTSPRSPTTPYGKDDVYLSPPSRANGTGAQVSPLSASFSFDNEEDALYDFEGASQPVLGVTASLSTTAPTATQSPSVDSAAAPANVKARHRLVQQTPADRWLSQTQAYIEEIFGSFTNFSLMSALAKGTPPLTVELYLSLERAREATGLVPTTAQEAEGLQMRHKLVFDALNEELDAVAHRHSTALAHFRALQQDISARAHQELMEFVDNTAPSLLVSVRNHFANYARHVHAESANIEGSAACNCAEMLARVDTKLSADLTAMQTTKDDENVVYGLIADEILQGLFEDLM